MTTRRILTLLLLLAMASVSAWGIAITNGAPPPGVIGQSYNFQFTADAGATWSMTGLPAGLGLTLSSSGLLSAPQLRQIGQFPFTVTATATAVGGGAVTTDYLLVVNNGPPTVDRTTFNPKAGVGVAYSSQLGVLGGKPPFQWLLGPGNNNGISIAASTGLLSGTPVSSGIVSLIVQVSDSSSAFGNAQLQLNVIGIDTTTLPAGAIGTAYSQTLQASGGVAPLVWTLTGTSPLPPGLALNSSGIISGSPTANGTFPFSVAVTDSTQNSVTKSLIIVIGSALSITTATLPNATIGIAYSQTLQATGGSPAYTWSATGLPPGVTLGATTGTLSGTPTAVGPQDISVTVTDTALGTATTRLTLTINTLVISPTSLPNGSTNAPYSAALGVTGGQTSLAWTVTTGSLPNGLNLNATTGAIAGTPTAAGSFPFTVTVSYTPASPTPVSVSQPFTILIATTPTLTFTGLPTAAGQQSTLVGTISNAYPLNITGTLQLTFAPASGLPDDPNIQFMFASATSSRQAAFTIPAGSTQATFTNGTTRLATGTVAGIITIATTALADSDGVPIAPPAPSTITINPTAPAITKVTADPPTTTGFNIFVTGYSTPRDMTSVVFHFVAPTGTTLAAADITVPLTSAFTSWYGSPASNAFGSQFTLKVPFTFTGPAGSTVPYTAVRVEMVNSRATSATFGPVSP